MMEIKIIASSLLAFLFIFSNQFDSSIGANLRNEIPHVRIIEIHPNTGPKVENGETENIIEKPPNSDIIVGEDIAPNSKLLMECDASYPVQWVYNGDGMPVYSTNTSAIPLPISKPAPIFVASISLGFTRQLAAQDSGKYTCRSLQSPTLSVFYNLYVGDKRLFTNPGGDNIYYKRTDPSVRIPCSVSNPKAVVSLQKSVNGLVQCPLNESITYDATKGFELKISNYFDPAGVYVCTAGYNDTYQVSMYTLVPEATPENLEERRCQKNEDCPINHYCTKSSKGYSCTAQVPKNSCQKNDDCPSNQACIRSVSGYSCTSPCSLVCGRNTQCETVNHVPRCYCLPDFKGDPYHSCVKPQQHWEQNPQTDPCNPNPCGANTVCDRIGNTGRCSCTPGFTGDPYVRCYTKNVCEPNPCGPNSDCTYRNGYASCTCKTGFYGQPPYCRAECEVDHHCTFDKACQYGRCRNPCEGGACKQFFNTECRVIRRQAVCARIQTRCPTGYYGRDCQSIYTKDDNTPTPPQVTGSDPDEKPVSPCVPFPCGEKAECVVKSFQDSILNVTRDVALCQCPPKTTGNADMECYPVEEQIELVRNDSEVPDTLKNRIDEDVTNPSIEPTVNTTASTDCVPSCPPNSICVLGKCQVVESTSTTEAKSCGINAISIVTDGKSMCACPAGYTGLASIECHLIKINDETEVVEVNITNSTSTACNRFPCGKNTHCIVGDGNVAVCECILNFEGNPWIGCEKNCTKNDECPETQLCHEKSNRCVDPCEREFQPFFTQCGRDAKCKVKDHVPYCYCPDELPHGSPHIHCKEKAWMPNHHVSNSSCEKENTKSLKCGPNTACKRFHDENEYCVCLPGFFGEPNDEQGCKLGLQCRRDIQCQTDEECMNGKCLSVCRKRDLCGPMAGCKGENHKANCICHIGTIQNPKGECVPATGALAERLLFYRSFEDV